MESQGAAPSVLPARLVALVLLLAGAFLVLRAPRVLLEGRFWAEEGTVYFAAARGDGLGSLLRPHQGYLNLAANAAAAVAALPIFPLEAAARVTVVAALLLQLLPPLLLLTRRAAWLPGPGARLSAVALYLLARPSNEVWLNTANSQFVLGVAAAILLATESSRAGRGPTLTLVGFAGLSGVPANLLFPLFWFEARRTRSRERFGEALLLTGCAAVQMVFVLSSFAGGARSARTDLDLLLPVLLSKSVILPFLSDRSGGDLALRLYLELARGGHAAPIALVALALVLVFALATWRVRSPEAALLATAALLLTVAGFSGALGVDRAAHLRFVLPGESERYAWAPNVLLLLSLLALGVRASGTHRLVRAVAFALAAAASIHGLRSTFLAARELPLFYGGPSWPAEVRAWRADPTRRVRLWPADWTLDLGPGGEGAAPQARH